MHHCKKIVAVGSTGFFRQRRQFQHESTLFQLPQGSRKNKFAMLGVEAPVRQDVKTQAYLSSVEFSQRRRLGCIGFQHVKLFFREPFASWMRVPLSSPISDFFKGAFEMCIFNGPPH
jgi:hypothetical protein